MRQNDLLSQFETFIEQKELTKKVLTDERNRLIVDLKAVQRLGLADLELQYLKQVNLLTQALKEI